MTNYQIKLLAALLMTIDHVGAVFFPNLYLLRAIGRFSFPLFAWLLVEGEAHTKNVQKYALRLLGMAVLSQPIYLLTFDQFDLNILFTLLVGLVCLRLTRSTPQAFVPIWVVGALLAHALKLNYGSYGIVLICSVSRFRSTPEWWTGWILLHLIFFAIGYFTGFQIPALFSPLLFYLANQQPGAKARWFYWFYPLHLLALWLIQTL